MDENDANSDDVENDDGDNIAQLCKFSWPLANPAKNRNDKYISFNEHVEHKGVYLRNEQDGKNQ